MKVWVLLEATGYEEQEPFVAFSSEAAAQSVCDRLGYSVYGPFEVELLDAPESFRSRTEYGLSFRLEDWGANATDRYRIADWSRKEWKSEQWHHLDFEGVRVRTEDKGSPKAIDVTVTGFNDEHVHAAAFGICRNFLKDGTWPERKP